jgi:GMP synthase-like glutamine amidotransferase
MLTQVDVLKWSAMPTCLVVQHVAPESPFAIEDALLAAEIDIDVRHLFAGEPVPNDVTGLDGLVVMGGPMSAVSDQGFPTRESEVALIAGAVKAGLPTLGICLGAQLIAAAAGAAVYPGELGPEIGWSTVTLTQNCEADVLFTGISRNLTVLQWHGDTFDVPPGAVRLVGNSIYPNQAFRIGNAAWGVQFHLEVTAQGVDDFLTAFASDLNDIAGGAETIRRDTTAALEELAPSRDLILGRFAALVAARVTAGELVAET